MHPNPKFRGDDRALLETLIEEIGFGMVFLTTPQGPRVAHVPLMLTDDGKLRFHLAKYNALSTHLESAKALIVINGPDGYVSPRHYTDRKTVPTWDYVTLELEGPVRTLADAELEDLLHGSIEQFENRLGGKVWKAEETPEDYWAKLFGAIVGFELEVTGSRSTLKLSQKKSAQDRENIALAHETNGNPSLAEWMKRVPE